MPALRMLSFIVTCVAGCFIQHQQHLIGYLTGDRRSGFSVNRLAQLILFTKPISLFVVQRRMKTGFVPILMLLSTAVLAQDGSTNLSGYEFFGGYSVNADYVKNRPLLFALDQKVSPFFSLGSGPYGFEFSVKRYVRKGMGVKTDFSGYYDPFPPSRGSYCQNSGCINGLRVEATSKTFYLTSGLEWKVRRDKRFAPFVQALGGIVHSRTGFTMSGSDSGQTFSGGVI